MARRALGVWIALVLVATLLLPLAPVGAQEETDPSAAPMTTEQTQPESEPSAVETEPLASDSQTEAPVAEPPVDEIQPEPAAADDAEQQSADDASDPSSDAVPSTGDEPTAIEAAGDTSVKPSEEAGPTVIENLTIDCAGLVTYDVVEAHGEELGVLIRTTDPNVATGPMDEIGGFILFITSEGHSSSSVDISGDPGNLFVTINSSTMNGPIAESPLVSCHEITEPDPDPDPEPEEPGPASTISNVSITCDGTVTFTIDEAQGDTLRVILSALHIPPGNATLADDEFVATATGTFTLQFDILQHNSVNVTVLSTVNDQGASATVFGCTDSEDIWNEGVSGVSLTCDGTVSFTVDDTDWYYYALALYGSNGGSWQLIDGMAISDAAHPIEAGSQTHTFAIPADTWDSLRVDVKSRWTLLGTDTVSGCLGDEPPDPTNAPEISNLRLFCNGLTRFDLATDEPVDLLVVLWTDAIEGWQRTSYGTFDAGSQEVRFGVPAAWFDDLSVSIVYDGDPVASASVSGCLTSDPNEITGDEILVVTTYGSVLFDRVTEGGETIIDRYTGPTVWELPDGFEPDSARFFDLSTTATFEGSIQVCLNLSQDMIDNPDRVRILQFWQGGVIQPDTEVYPNLGIACANATQLSPFATALLAGEPEPELILPVVQNLATTCTGLVTFDLETTEPVELQIWVGTPAQAPGFHAETYVTLASGPQQVQLDIPVGRFDRHTALVALDADEWHELATTTISGCRDQTTPPNTPAGPEVEVETGGGTVGFEYVLVPGVTRVTVIDPGQAPALPADFDPNSAILLDIASTAVFEGSVQICLPMSDAMRPNADNVRLLHYDNGAWVNITTSSSSSDGNVCGVTDHFSPFAIVERAGTRPVDPDKPTVPTKPDNVRPNPGHTSSANGSAVTGFPNTGSGTQATGVGVHPLLPIAGILLLFMALGLRPSTKRMRGARSR